jgi:glycosidase
MRLASSRYVEEHAALIALGSALLLGCSAAASSQSRGASNENDAPPVELLVADADVWAWTARVSGVARTDAEPRRCAIRVGDREVRTTLRAARFSADVPLQEGENLVRAVCRWSDGAERRSQAVRLRVRLRDVPQAHAALSIQGAEVHVDARRSTPSPGSRAPLVAYAWTERRGGLRADAAQRTLGNMPELRVDPPAADGVYVYEAAVVDARGRSQTARVVLTWHDGRPVPTRHWVDDAVFYGVVPPFFGSPPLRSVEKAVPALAELGVTALWLSPSFPTLPEEFGYAVTDYFDVRRDYGTRDDLSSLVRTAHAHGLRVVLDIVPNHSSAHHPYFEQAQELGQRSRYFSFYARNAAREATYYFDWEHLPNLNFEHPEVRAWITEAGKHWLDRFDIDGYRVDAVWGIKERRPSLLRAWSEALQQVEPEALLVAEASARDPFYVQNGFHGAYDWTKQVGKWAWEHVFDAPRGIARRLHAAVAETARHTTQPQRVFRFLNNNDTGKRFIARHGPDLTRVATAALLTLPGVPCLYSFDEVGTFAEPYAGLRPVARSHDPQLYAWHRRWIHLRRSHAALRAAGFVPLATGETNEVYAYLRHTEDGGEALIVVLNFSSSPTRVELSVPEEFTQATRGPWRTLPPTPAGEYRGATLALELAAWDARVLVSDRAFRAKGR